MKRLDLELESDLDFCTIYYGLYSFTAIDHKVVQIGDTEIICLLLYNNFVTYGIWIVIKLSLTLLDQFHTSRISEKLIELYLNFQGQLKPHFDV